jgi:hypothetical protein
MFQRLISSAIAAALILAAMPLFVSAPAQARFPHGSASGTCLQAVDNGCAGANQNSNYTTTLASSRQSGQTWTSSHPMNFNVPAVDYPVGYDTTLTLKDPQTDAYVLSECTYTNATGTFLCNNGDGPTFNGYDWTGAISAYGHAFSLQFGPNESGTCTVTNSKFLQDGTNSNSALWIKNNTCNRVVKYNQFLGGGIALTTQCCSAIQDDSRDASNSSDYEYNAFPNQSWNRIITSVGSGGAGLTRTIKYNYISGLGNKNDGNHSETDLYGGQSPGGVGYTVNSVEWSSNYIVWPSNILVTASNTTFFAGTGDLNNYKSLATVMNSNVIVCNSAASGGAPGHCLVDGQWANLGAVTANNNYIDPWGSSYCASNGLDNQNGVATVSGNTATFTGGSVYSEAGYFISGPGLTQRNVTAASGPQFTQTVTFDGAAVGSLGSISVIVVPGMASLTSSGNKNLTDGSSVDLTYPYFTPAVCNNAGH